MTAKNDLEAMFPDRAGALKLCQAYGGHYWVCPGGHPIPHRTVHGRCRPDFCVGDAPLRGKAPTATQAYQREMDLLPLGAENHALDTEVSTPAEAEMLAAQAEEAVKIARSLGIMKAMKAAHPFPDMPAPPKHLLNDPKAYVRQRLSDIAPFLLEAKIWQALHASQDRKDAALEELLDRSGAAPRKPDGQPDTRGPVLIVNVGGGTPYDRQTVTISTEGVSHVRGEPQAAPVVPHEAPKVQGRLAQGLPLKPPGDGVPVHVQSAGIEEAAPEDAERSVRGEGGSDG